MPMEVLYPLLLALFFPTYFAAANSNYATPTVSSCLLAHGIQNFTTPSETNYYRLLNFSIQNLRFAGADVPKPVVIILPCTKEQLRDAVVCVRQSSLTIRLRSGGHSYEGLSYTARRGALFAVVDLMNLNRVHVDPTSATAWAEAGATVGEIYHAVAESSRSLAFSAGSCATIGSGGHISGGGFGLLSRKYGIAADNVLDAIIVDSAGRVLDRASMGEDVFWAIRGGGGGSWAAIYAWKLQLVPVPERVTVFSPSRSGSTRLISKLVYKWQLVAPRLPDEFYLSIFLAGSGDRNITASFTGLVLGERQLAVSTLTQRFPELGVSESDCTEVSWIESSAQFAGLNSVSDLTNRESTGKSFFKAKSDYVKVPIARDDLISALDFLSKRSEAYIIVDPYGGAMGRIAVDQLPFPHRAGNLYSIQYMIDWTDTEDVKRGEYVTWLRGFHVYMGRLVSTRPREAYVNYVDLDLGTDECEKCGPRLEVGLAKVWAQKYFGGNYDRLVKAKTRIDPLNFFNNQQSIPPLRNNF